MKQRLEILAPAGDYETLKAAVNEGADAVYAGGERFGARAYAKNFSRDELLSAIDYVHIHGKKLYLTVNTLVKEKEFSLLYEYLLPFYRQGLDAVIVQDVGVMEYIRRQFPELPVHASTQMTITHVLAARYLESLGVTRIVPARELSLEEIRKIRSETDLEIECFVHGALCYCYSGQCLLSSMIGGRSGNRGQCAQPCRLPYQTGDGQDRDLLSLKDLCMIEAIPDLAESGILSFKIEGRMKKPGYVAAVTRMYRKYADLYLKYGRDSYRVEKSDLVKLQNAYQRRGYCNGYYYRHNGKDMLSLERPKQEPVTEWKPDTRRQETVNGRLTARPGRPVILQLWHKDIETEVYGPVAEPAKKQPASREGIEKQLRKTGNTEFVFDKLEVCIEGEVFLPVQAMNELRRRGLKAVEDLLLKRYSREPGEKITLTEDGKAQESCHKDILWTAGVESLEQFEAVMDHTEISRIYVEDALWGGPARERLRKLTRQAQESGKQVYFSMARIFRQEAEAFYDRHFMELAECFDGALARNLESCLYIRDHRDGFPVTTDSSVYLWNRLSAKWWERLPVSSATAPVELNRKELGELDTGHMEIIVYGYLPVMISAGCIRKNTAACRKESGFLSMKDRLRKKMMVKNECLYCYNVIYNNTPLFLAGQYKELRELRPEAFRMQFTSEDKKTAEAVLETFRAVYMEEGDCPGAPVEFTRGHFRRGVK